MKQKFIILIFLFFIIIAVSYMTFYIVQNQKDKESKIKQLPNLSLYDFNNIEYQIYNKVYNQPLLLVFVQSDCGHCHRLIKQLSDNITILKNMKILLVSSESLNQVKWLNQFITTEKITLLLDKNNTFSSVFKVKHFPTLFLFDKNKKLVKSFVGTVPIKKIISEITYE